MLDYQYESEQVSHTAEEITQDEWVFHDVPTDAYGLLRCAVEQSLPNAWSFADGARVGLFVDNLLNEEYQNALE